MVYGGLRKSKVFYNGLCMVAGGGLRWFIVFLICLGCSRWFGGGLGGSGWFKGALR